MKTKKKCRAAKTTPPITILDHNEVRLRQDCLELASRLQFAAGQPDEIVKAAETFFTFISSK